MCVLDISDLGISASERSEELSELNTSQDRKTMELCLHDWSEKRFKGYRCRIPWNFKTVPLNIFSFRWWCLLVLLLIHSQRKNEKRRRKFYRNKFVLEYLKTILYRVSQQTWKLKDDLKVVFDLWYDALRLTSFSSFFVT